MFIEVASGDAGAEFFIDSVKCCYGRVKRPVNQLAGRRNDTDASADAKRCDDADARYAS